MNEHKRLAEEMRGIVLKMATFMPKEHGVRGRDFDRLRGRLYEAADQVEALGRPAVTQLLIERAIWEIAGAVGENWEFDQGTEDGVLDVQGFAKELWDRLKR